MVTKRLYEDYLNENAFLMKETNHVRLQNLHGDDLNENNNFIDRKLIIHDYIILHGGDLNANEHFKMINYS